MGKFDGWSMKDILRKKAERRRVLDERKKKRPLSASQYTRMCDALFMPQFRGKPCEVCWQGYSIFRDGKLIKKIEGKVFNTNATCGHHVIPKSRSSFLRWEKKNICIVCQKHHNYGGDLSAHGTDSTAQHAFIEWFSKYRPDDYEYIMANKHTKPAMKSRGYFEKMTNLRTLGGSDGEI